MLDHKQIVMAMVSKSKHVKETKEFKTLSREEQKKQVTEALDKAFDELVESGITGNIKTREQLLAIFVENKKQE